jgi:hypothetical protein
MEAGNMADNKAKRPYSLAQLHPQPQPQLGKPRNPNPQPANATEQMPVKAHAYRAIAELNAGFEKVLQDLKALQPIGYLHTGRLAALVDLISRIRAETNQDLIATLHGREQTNAAYFDRLCLQWEKPPAS